MSICATIGRPILTKIDVCIHDGFVVFSDLKVDKEYLYYLLVYKQKAWSKCNQTGSQANLNTELINSESVLIPPSQTEQKTIAKVFDDIDSLINSLDALISKKQKIKQGVMQQLLIGEIRLPGFNESWKKTVLGELGDFFSGGTPDTSNNKYYGGDIPWITSSDLNMNKIYKVNNYITEIGLKNSAAKMVTKEMLLIALYGATAGLVGISYINAAINQAVLACCVKNAYVNFLYHKLKFSREKIRNTYTQGGQPNLNSAIIKSLIINIPLSQIEQKAIAKVLDDIDFEIEKLEKKLDKIKSIKQAMMQELLTGKTRLI